MPAYEDKVKRMTPQQFAEFLLKDRICKNCKWCDINKPKWPWGDCLNPKVDIASWVRYDFGCNQWEAKEVK